MKVAIVGAGAIGGYLGCELSRAGYDVTMIARRQTLAAIKANGLTLHIDGEVRSAHPKAVESAAEAGEQDYVIVAVKANAAPAIAESLLPMFGPKTAVVTATNGVPWWYFYMQGGEHDGKILNTVDPDGIQWRTLGPERAIGCVVYPAAEAVEPGVIKHISESRFTLGEPDGSKSDRVQLLAEAMRNAGFTAPVKPNIRNEIWVKLWGNLSFNPVSVLTRATLEDMASDPGVRSVIRAMMLEAQAVGEAVGARFVIDVDKRIEGARSVGAHRTSMLQDIDAGRPLEIDALVTVVQELGELAGIKTPTIDTIAALVRLRERDQQ